MNLREMTLPHITLGWELEATKRAAKKVDGIECGHDGSVGGESLEYRIKRKHVYDVEKSLSCLRALVTDHQLEVNSTCGFHVHLGLGNRTRRLHDWAQWFVQLAREVEAEAFQAVPSSRADNSYCKSWRVQPDSIGSVSYSPSKLANRDRYQWVNPVEVFRPGGIRTVEIRLMGNTKRYPYLLSWISVCRLMAMSSWALIFDASRLEKEKVKIKEAFKLISENFRQDGVPKKQIVTATVYLATKAGLSIPSGNPLTQLRTKEELLIRHAPSDGSALEWARTLSLMESEFNSAREQAIQNRTVLAVGGFMVGDTVEAVSVDEDGGLIVGHCYRVTNLFPHNRQSILLLISPGREWYVRPQHLRLVQRMNVEIPHRQQSPAVVAESRG